MPAFLAGMACLIARELSAFPPPPAFFFFLRNVERDLYHVHILKKHVHFFPEKYLAP